MGGRRARMVRRKAGQPDRPAAVVSQQPEGTLSSRARTRCLMAETELRPTAERDTALDRLVVEVATGDRIAFDALYRGTSARLFGICLRVLSDRTEAEDVLQDAFVTIW